MWTCRTCGEKLEDQFDACWKCGSSKEGVAPGQVVAEETPKDEGANLDVNGASVAPDVMLREILRVQQKQQAVLGDIQHKVGCLFTYMVVCILLGIFLALFSLTR
jgi:hypothetical protein